MPNGGTVERYAAHVSGALSKLMAPNVPNDIVWSMGIAHSLREEYQWMVDYLLKNYDYFKTMYLEHGVYRVYLELERERILVRVQNSFMEELITEALHALLNGSNENGGNAAQNVPHSLNSFYDVRYRRGWKKRRALIIIGNTIKELLDRRRKKDKAKRINAEQLREILTAVLKDHQKDFTFFSRFS